MIFAQAYSRDNVHIKVHDVSDVPGWDSYTKSEKRKILEEKDPVQESHQTNTTVNGLFEYIVDNLDTGQSVNEDASHLALGTSTTDPTVDDTALGNEVFRTGVTSTLDDGTSLSTSTFIDTSEANGNTIEEVGLFTASSGGTLLNHASVQSVAKTSSKTLTIDVTLTFDVPDAPSEITMNTVTRTTNYTANNEEIVLGDAGGGGITITLPSPADDVFVFIKKIDSTSNTVTIATPGSETIDGNSSLTLSAEDVSRGITSDGTNYFIF